MATPRSLPVARLGVFLPSGGSILVPNDGVDCRIRLLILVVTLLVAFTAIVPDFDSEPAVSPLVRRVGTLVSLPRCVSLSPRLRPASVSGIPSIISTFGIPNCRIEFTCSRLC